MKLSSADAARAGTGYGSETSSRRISRRSLLRAGAAGGLALTGAPLLAGCASDDAKGKATIRMWTWYSQQNGQWPKLVAEYEAKNPKIKIDNRVFGALAGSYEPAIDAAVAAEDPPEIFGPMGSAVVYGTNGIALDLVQALGKDFLSNFFPSTNQQYSYNGRQYGIGWMAQTFGLFYNPRMLKQAGVGVPETWDDLMNIVEPIRSKVNVDPFVTLGNDTDFFLPFITQASNDPTLMLELDAQNKKGTTWDCPAVRTAFGKIQELVKAKVFPAGWLGITGTQDQTLFYEKKTAILFEGSFIIQSLVEDAPAAFNKEYEIARTPAWSAGARHWCANQAGAGLSVSAKSKYAEEAVKFLKWMYEPGRYLKVMNDSNSMPSTLEAGHQVSNPRLKTMTSWLIEGDGCPHILGGTGSQTAVADAYTAIAEGKATPEEAAKKAQASVHQARNR